jgi:hypothetical protein
MSLRKYLVDPDVTTELARVMALAYDQIRITLQAASIELPLDMIAQRIAQEAQKGFHDSETLANRVLSTLLSDHKNSSSGFADDRSGRRGAGTDPHTLGARIRKLAP